MTPLSNRSQPFFVCALAVALTLGACGGDSPTDLGDIDIPASCGGTVVDLFPTPVSDASSPFDDVDDDFIQVNFAAGFDFSFYGSTYTSVFLNTNGGMTFGAGTSNYDVAADEVTVPGIAVFWGDLDAGGYTGAETRANQMKYEVCSDRFIVRYVQLQDNDDATWNNTASIQLEENGRVSVQYGTVLSEDILVGIFDGTHTDDDYVGLQGSYSGYATGSTGVILFDDWGPGPSHTGQALNGRGIVYNP